MNMELIETSAGSGVYTNENYSVRMQQVYKHPNYITCLVVTDGVTLSNTLFSVWETAPQSGIYRNFNEPIPTDLSPAQLAVPDFVPWQIKIGGISNPALITKACVSTSVDNVTITFSPTRGGVLWSDQIFVVTPNGNLEAPLPQGYTQLLIDPLESKWWDENHKDVTTFVTLDDGANIEVEMEKLAKSLRGAVVLQSLRWLHATLASLDPENRIAKPFLEMGYPVTRDYSAYKSKTLPDYAKGHVIWYSMSHGNTAGGKPRHPFNGLLFMDGMFTSGLISASDLASLNLNYKLVVIDGCCSAQTSLLSEPDSWKYSTLLPHAQAFANAFGPNVAYMGWSWSMESFSAQPWSSEFINNLKSDSGLGGGPTVEEAYQKFLDNHAPGTPNASRFSKTMKIHGDKGRIIDL